MLRVHCLCASNTFCDRLWSLCCVNLWQLMSSKLCWHITAWCVFAFKDTLLFRESFSFHLKKKKKEKVNTVLLRVKSRLLLFTEQVSDHHHHHLQMQYNRDVSASQLYPLYYVSLTVIADTSTYYMTLIQVCCSQFIYRRETKSKMFHLDHICYDYHIDPIIW